MQVTKFHFLLLLLLLSSAIYAGNKPQKSTAQKTVVVKINYGADRPEKTVNVAWFSNITALTALLQAAETVTHPVAEYVFVTGIDDVRAERGKTAWYYRVNGKAAKKLAIYQAVQAGDTVSWRFVKDICSPKVDNKCSDK